jgi:mono/diheme cytochrome c family protein
MKVVICRVAAAVVIGTLGCQGAVAQSASVERGRYLARIAGCNDCHTTGYAQTGGKVAEDKWLLGDNVGFSGPWGTTYPANLRLSLAKMTEDQWLAFARSSQLRPPMPWFALRDMSTADLRSIYRFTRQLPGGQGQPAPAFVPPGTKAAGPVITFPAN